MIMTPYNNDNHYSHALENSTETQARPQIKTPGRSDAVEAEISLVSPGIDGVALADHSTREPVVVGEPSPHIELLGASASLALTEDYRQVLVGLLPEPAFQNPTVPILVFSIILIFILTIDANR